MKKLVFLLVSILVFFSVNAQSPFTRGVNLTGWFQVSGPRQIQFTKFSKKDFENIKSLGCDVIRLPINLHFMTNGAPDYVIDPLFFQFLDSAVTWAEELHIHLILDNHTFDPAVSTTPDVEEPLLKVWPQMAEHYKNRSEYIYYEVLNEPHGITDQQWGTIQQHVISAIREIDTVHYIVVGPASWNSYNNLTNLPVYNDDKLIYTFHFYDPFLFTHQGATWTDPSMAPLEGVPFPYAAGSMPSFPSELNDTWIESSFNNYQNDGTIAKVKQLIDIAVAFKNSRNVPVYCGEFGVYIPNSPVDDRHYWYEVVRSYMEEKGISWTIWDYKGGFGIFDDGSNEIFEYDVDTALVRSLGLNIPEKHEYVMLPDSTGFAVYTDYIGENVFESGNAGSGIIDFYSTENPNNGSRCIYWTGGDQYVSIGFDFVPDKDMSILENNGYALDMMIRGKAPETAMLDIRFLDSKTVDPEDHPWRMRYTIDNVEWDGKWHHLHIPLSSFTEQGSWDNNTWYSPAGEFDWTAVDRFEIVAEYHALTDMKFWFDNILVTDEDTAEVRDTSTWSAMRSAHANINVSVYPNPANERVSFSFYLPAKESVSLNIFNLNGQQIASLLNDIEFDQGLHHVNWDMNNKAQERVQDGIYYYVMRISGKLSTGKLVVVN